MPDQTPEPLTDDDLTPAGPMAGRPNLEANERYRRMRERDEIAAAAPEPLTDARLLQLRDDEYVCTTPAERSMAAELLEARARIAELEAKGDAPVDYDGRLAYLGATGRRLLDEKHEASRWAAWFAAERDYIRSALTQVDVARRLIDARAREIVAEEAAQADPHAKLESVRLSEEQQHMLECGLDPLADLTDADVEVLARQSAPHAYIAVKRHHSPNADRPEWLEKAFVVPTGDPWELREGLEQEGFEFLPVVGTETGTRPAAPALVRCQTTTAIAVWDGVADDRSIWCDLPNGHDGKHHATVPQPGNQDAIVHWGNPPTERIGYAIGYRIDSEVVSLGSDYLYQAPGDAATELAAAQAEAPATPFRVYELREVRGE